MTDVVLNQLKKESVMASALYEVMYDPDWPAVNDFRGDAKIILDHLRKSGFEIVPISDTSPNWRDVATAFRELLQALEDDVILRNILRLRGFDNINIKTVLDGIELYNLAEHKEQEK